MKTYNQLKEMFLTSNQALIRDDMDLLDSQVSERSLWRSLDASSQQDDVTE